MRVVEVRSAARLAPGSRAVEQQLPEAFESQKKATALVHAEPSRHGSVSVRDPRLTSRDVDTNRLGRFLHASWGRRDAAPLQVSDLSLPRDAVPCGAFEYGGIQGNGGSRARSFYTLTVRFDRQRKRRTHGALSHPFGAATQQRIALDRQLSYRHACRGGDRAPTTCNRSDVDPTT